MLPNVVEDRNILLTLKIRNAKWIGHIWHRNFILKHVIEEKIEGKMDVMVRVGRRRKQLLDDLEKKQSMLKIERGCTDPPSVESSLWKSVCTCRK